MIVNRARAAFFAQTLGVPLTAESEDVATTVAAPDLTIAKTHTGPLTGGASTPFTLARLERRRRQPPTARRSP